MDDKSNNDIDNLQSADDLQDQGDLDNGADLDQQQGSDSGTDSEPEHEENTEGRKQKPVNQDAINEAIARQHAKYREEQRQRLALEKELNELRSGKASAADPEPKIFEVDPYADDVADQIKQRDESIRAHAAWVGRQQQRQMQQQQYQQQTELQKRQQAAEQAEQFFSRAKEDGVDQQKLGQAVQTVGMYQLGMEVAQYLMADDKGYQMTLHLAKDPALLAELSLMEPYQRILHIERNVRARVSVKPRSSQANKPVTRVKGRASDVSDRFPLTGSKVTVE